MSSSKNPAKGKKRANVPVIMQMEATECGAASLAMVLAYYGKWVPLEQVRVTCGVSRDGSNAKNVLKAARFYGLDAKPYRMEIEGLRVRATFPCILFMGFTHFVVLTGIDKKYVYINDPAAGRVKMGMEEFGEKFTGVVLTFAKGEEFVADGRPADVKQFVRDNLKGVGTAFAVTAVVVALVSIIQFITPGFSVVFVDKLLSGENPEWLKYLVGIMAMLGVAEIILGYIEECLILKLRGKLETAGNAGFFWHVMNLPMEFFAQRSAGDVLARQVAYSSVSVTLIQELAPLVFQTILMVLYFILLVTQNCLLTLVALGAIIINGIVARLISKKRIDILKVYDREANNKEATLVSGIQMISSIKSAGGEIGYFESWAGHQAAEKKALKRATEISSGLGIIPVICTGVADLAVLILGVIMISRGEFTIGLLLAFQGFLDQFYAPVTGLIDASQTIQEMRVDMERIDDVMKYDGADKESRASDRPITEEDEKLDGNISVKNVTFGYAPLGEPVIKDFNLELTPGKQVAIVGPSGCGKSTIAKLLAGLYKPWSGEILYSGKHIEEIPRSIFGSSLTVVNQDIVLFEDTIKNNIKLWDSSIDDFEVIMAARDVQMHSEILRMKNGYDTVLKENGKNLSGGQRQRLEIARALAPDAPILIMDEATSALDARTEYDLMKAVRARGVTCVLIAHRLSTIRDCDEIIVLEDGVTVERGTHEELYAAGGRYSELIGTE